MLSFATGTSVTAATISAAVTAGSTAQSIAAVPPIVTERQPTDSAAGHAATQSQTGNPTPAMRLAGKAATSQASVRPAAGMVVLVAGPVRALLTALVAALPMALVAAPVTALAPAPVTALAPAPAPEAPIASAAETCRAMVPAGAAAAMPSAGGGGKKVRAPRHRGNPGLGGWEIAAAAGLAAAGGPRASHGREARTTGANRW